MLPRVLETELMDTPAEAQEYDSMDHAEVNRQFVSDLLAAAEWGDAQVEVLDLGTGTALIPIELCRRQERVRVLAADGAASMLRQAGVNLALSGCEQRIMLDRMDAKELPLPDGRFDAVISNSIVHHVPEPAPVLSEAVRVTAPGGLLFFRDLLRPADRAQLEQLVEAYAGQANEHQRQMFADSLHAALTVEEMQALVADLGFSPETVAATSDRHWTWCARKPA